MTGHGGRLEPAVVGLVLLGLVLGLERALPLEVTSHPAHGVLEHFAHVAGSQLAERLPDELPLLLMIRPVEKDHVKVGVQPLRSAAVGD